MADSRNSLTHLERACLQSVAQGQCVDSIAQQSDKSASEIEVVLASARLKLTASTNVEAIARALKLGLIE